MPAVIVFRFFRSGTYLVILALMTLCWTLKASTNFEGLDSSPKRLRLATASDDERSHRLLLYDRVEREMLERFIGLESFILEVLGALRSIEFRLKAEKKPDLVKAFGLPGCGKTTVILAIVEALGLLDQFTRVQIEPGTTDLPWESLRDAGRPRSSKQRGKQRDLPSIVFWDEAQHMSVPDRYTPGHKALWRILGDGTFPVTPKRPLDSILGVVRTLTDRALELNEKKAELDQGAAAAESGGLELTSPQTRKSRLLFDRRARQEEMDHAGHRQKWRTEVRSLLTEIALYFPILTEGLPPALNDQLKIFEDEPSRILAELFSNSERIKAPADLEFGHVVLVLAANPQEPIELIERLIRDKPECATDPDALCSEVKARKSEIQEQMARFFNRCIHQKAGAPAALLSRWRAVDWKYMFLDPLTGGQWDRLISNEAYRLKRVTAEEYGVDPEDIQVHETALDYIAGKTINPIIGPRGMAVNVRAVLLDAFLFVLKNVRRPEFPKGPFWVGWEEISESGEAEPSGKIVVKVASDDAVHTLYSHRAIRRVKPPVVIEPEVAPEKREVHRWAMAGMLTAGCFLFGTPDQAKVPKPSASGSHVERMAWIRQTWPESDTPSYRAGIFQLLVTLAGKVSVDFGLQDLRHAFSSSDKALEVAVLRGLQDDLKQKFRGSGTDLEEYPDLFDDHLIRMVYMSEDLEQLRQAFSRLARMILHGNFGHVEDALRGLSADPPAEVIPARWLVDFSDSLVSCWDSAWSYDDVVSLLSRPSPVEMEE